MLSCHLCLLSTCNYLLDFEFSLFPLFDCLYFLLEYFCGVKVSFTGHEISHNSLLFVLYPTSVCPCFLPCGGCCAKITEQCVERDVKEHFIYSYYSYCHLLFLNYHFNRFCYDLIKRTTIIEQTTINTYNNRWFFFKQNLLLVSCAIINLNDVHLT